MESNELESTDQKRTGDDSSDDSDNEAAPEEAPDKVEEVVDEQDHIADDNLRAINTAVVFEELADRLEVLSSGIDAHRPELRTLSSIEYDQDVNRPKLYPAEGWVLMQHYESRLQRRAQQIGGDHPLKLLGTALLEASLRGNTIAQKLQMDRAHLEHISQQIMKELIQKNTQGVLTEEVEAGKEDQERLGKLLEIVEAQDEERRSLRMAIKRTKMSKKHEMAKLQIKIKQMEDDQYQLRERTTLENKYNDTYCAMLKRKSHRYWATPSYDCYLTTLDIKKKMVMEDKAHISFAEYIRVKFKESQALLDYWQEKYETDKEVLTSELDHLKEEREKCLERIAFIKNYIKLYKPIVDDDKRLKKIVEDRKKHLELEHKKATKIQAVWRGYMVRKGLLWYDPKILFKKDDEDDGKKGKKDKKGK